MTDPRISRLVEVARRLREGEYEVDLPPPEGDELDRLGAALQDLSHALDRRFRRLRALREVTERASAGLLLEEVCDQVYESFRDAIPYERMGLALLEDGGSVVRARWARSEAPQVCLEQGYSALLAGSSLAGILASGKPRILNDLVTYLSRHPDSHASRLMVREGVRSSLTCPLVADGHPIGFLFFSSFQRHTYEREHVELYELIANELAHIIERSRMYQELLALVRLKDRVLGMAAHDLRNPLQLVQANLELLELGYGGELSPEGRQLVGRAVQASDRMLALVEDLLSEAAIASGELVLRPLALELDPWLPAHVEAQGVLAASKGIELACRVAPDLRVWADPLRLDQVLTNLVSNALKFSPPGGTVEIQALADQGGVRIDVRDAGPGIPEADQERIFEAFTRARGVPAPEDPSTGLGLTICRRIVQAHSGRLTVASTVGRGSTFSVWLPRPD